MDGNRTNGTVAALVVVSGITVFLLAVYVVGYLSCGVELKAIGHDRSVGSAWQATLYAPAARIESAISGIPVDLWYDGGVYRVPRD